MADVGFVRQEMVPSREAPGSAVGPVRWARENLFSSWLNTTLTIVSILAIWWLVRHVWPWFAHSVWHAGSLAECREIVKATWGEGASGACFAVIRERWQQFLFGFYPSALYWRPTLAFGLLFVALAPILFSGTPRRLLWFTLVFPGVVYWLLWGGPLSLPLAIYAGFVLGALTLSLVAARMSRIVAVIAAVLVTLAWLFYAAAPVAKAVPFLTLVPVSSKLFGGFMLSIVIGMTGIAFSLPLGILLALGRRSDMFLVKTLCVGFIEFIRGVPLITLLLVASFLLNIFMPPGTNFDIIVRVIIMVTLFSAAYIAETIRGGLAALPRGQYEAADALGLDYWKSMRLIIMPQALKISIPSLVGNFISLFKDTTLVAIIGLLDPIGLTTAIRGDTDWNGIVWELYGFVALVFFVCCYSMGRYSRYLERKLQTGQR